MRAVALIPARAGSKRIPGKNMLPFEGRPLVAFSIVAAARTPEVARVVVSTDDPAVEAVARDLGAVVHVRPEELAGDFASTFGVLKHVYARLEENGNAPEYLVLLQPTSPLRTAGLVSRGIQMMDAEPRASSLVAVFQQQAFTGEIHDDGRWVSDFPEDTRSQDLPRKYVPTGSLYIYRCDRTICVDDALGDHVLPLIEPEERCVNIDHPHDLFRLRATWDAFRDDYKYLVEDL